ncbi:hypothetical protein B0H34DRAFT_424864 [Crassisporium funariophilum]|nr:hypothetical protein B0H34DRAFT_424864 [Crassisporium funariophilum]
MLFLPQSPVNASPNSPSLNPNSNNVGQQHHSCCCCLKTTQRSNGISSTSGAVARTRHGQGNNEGSSIQQQYLYCCCCWDTTVAVQQQHSCCCCSYTGKGLFPLPHPICCFPVPASLGFALLVALLLPFLSPEIARRTSSRLI